MSLLCVCGTPTCTLGFSAAFLTNHKPECKSNTASPLKSTSLMHKFNNFGCNCRGSVNTWAKF